MAENLSEDLSLPKELPLPKGISPRVGWQVAICLLYSLLLHLSLMALLSRVSWKVGSESEVVQVRLIEQAPKLVSAPKVEKPSPQPEGNPIARPEVRKAALPTLPRVRPKAPGEIRPIGRIKSLKEELLAPGREIVPQEAKVSPLGAEELQELAPLKEPDGLPAPGPEGPPSDLKADSLGLDNSSLFGPELSAGLAFGPGGDGGLGGGAGGRGRGEGSGGSSGSGGWGKGGLGGGGLGDFKGSFDSYLGVLKRTGLDVVFVFDSTGSMEWVIEEVKAKVASLIGVIKRMVPIARVGMVAYRDWGEEYVTRMRDLTTDVNQLKAFLSGVKAEAGGDWEEAVEEALRVAVEGVRWRKGSKKMIILIGDAPPHKEHLPKALDLAAKFHQQQGGVVSAIDATHESNDPSVSNYNSANSLPEFAAITAKAEGETANLKDKKIIKQLVILTFGSRWKDVMEEYTGDL